jgi:hypothetical protein
MYVSSLGSSAGELLDASLELARRNYRVILLATLPLLLLTAIVELVLELVGLSSSSTFTGMLLILIPWSLAEALAVAACWCLLHGEPCTFVDSWKRVAPRAAAIVSSYAVKWLLIIPALFLLIVPGLYFIVLFFALPAVNIAEGASFRGALKRSRALSRGRFKRIATTLGLVELGVFVLTTIVSFVIPGGTWETPSTWDVIAGWVIYTMLLPPRAALMTLLYLDMRTTREGYDLTVSLGDLSRAV